jgi:hypothetical protein
MHGSNPSNSLVALIQAFLVLAVVPQASRCDELAPIVQGVAAPAPPLPSLSLLPGDSSAQAAFEAGTVDVWHSYCNQCDEPGCGGCGGRGSQGLRFVLSAEFLNARPTFSQPLAFVRQVRPNVAGVDGVQTSRDDDVNYDFSREGNLRAALAIRSDACASELRLVYWNLEAADTVADVATTNAAGDNVFLDMWDVTALIPGERLTATTRVEGNVYDLMYSRCVQERGNCGAAACCVPWDLHWSAGVRFSDWSIHSSVVTTADSNGRAVTFRDFHGAGPIIGFDGHRSLAILPGASVYAGLNTGLLLGQHDYRLTRSTTVGPNQNLEVFSSHQDRIVPVTELEVGLAWQWLPSTKISAGWFHQVWWDLGLDEVVTRGDVQLGRDGANIMAWDGLTLRGEVSF